MREDPSDKNVSKTAAARYSLLAAAALCLPLLALAVSATVFSTSVSFKVFSIAALFAIQFIVVVYLIAGPAALGLPADKEGEDGIETVFDPETEERLQVLEEAGNLLGGSLKLRDMFRIVVAKSSEIVRMEDPVLLVTGSGMREPRVIAPDPLHDQLPAALRELAAEAEGKRSSVIRRSGEAESVRWFAVPLFRAGEVFSVVTGRLVETSREERKILILLDAIAERVSPVIFAALSFDEKEANALVDVLTGLPNGRAFDLVLANRLAEAQRARGGARLMVLAMDIKDFSGFNSRFGHGTGDRLLVFTSEVIKEQLRKMDLVARTGGDEFLAVLPSAGAETADAIVGRIRNELAYRKFELPNGEPAVIEINLGSFVYGPDASNASDLISLARAERDGSKSSKSNQVLRFPTKHGN
ncbi:MAG: GGDEF domain-containing protein [Aridibacter famidurans]|nr:GGDEF domain-containing protein [Aridibacter famidurans]